MSSHRIIATSLHTRTYNFYDKYFWGHNKVDRICDMPGCTHIFKGVLQPQTPLHCLLLGRRKGWDAPNRPNLWPRVPELQPASPGFASSLQRGFASSDKHNPFVWLMQEIIGFLWVEASVYSQMLWNHTHSQSGYTKEHTGICKQEKS